MVIQLSSALFMALADGRLQGGVGTSFIEGRGACLWMGVGAGRRNRGVCISSEFIYCAVTLRFFLLP